jgi:4-amino-4-deoxy-L-arabinose transferase-like glycosyltransferase
MNFRRWDHRRVLLVILGASVVVRVLVAWQFGNTVEPLPGIADQVSYDELARRVLHGNGFSFATNWWPLTRAGEPTAHWSYLYTLFLTGVYGVLGPHPLAARLIQAVAVGLAHPWLAFALARRLFGARTGLVAAGLTALYAYFVYYSAALMTEAFYITCVLSSLYLAVRIGDDKAGLRPTGDAGFRYGQVVALGFSLGAAVLLRQVFLLLIPFFLGWLWWAGARRPMVTAAVVTAVVAAMILPFTVYNSLRFQRFILLNTNAGFAFFWANHPIHGTRFVPILTDDMASYADLVPPELRSLDEASLDQALLSRGIGFVLEDPQRYLLLSASRIPEYFKFWPSADSSMMSNVSRVASFGLLWPFMLFGLVVGLGRPLRARGLRANAGALLLAGCAAVYTILHLLSWALIRYRLPVDGILIVFAGVGVVEVAERLAAWRLQGPAAGPVKWIRGRPA